MNTGKKPMYQVKRVGDAANTMPAMQKHPDAIPNADNATISLDKLSGYSLNQEHEKGGHKARRFRVALGFDESHAQEIADQVKRLLPAHPAKLGDLDKHGQRYSVDLSLTGPAGSATVRSAWIVAKEGDPPRLVSIYVKGL